MGPLARIGRDLGYDVTGSDLTASRYTEQVAADGIKVIIDQSEASIAKVHADKPIDWLVYSSSLPADAPELKFAKDHNIKTSKRDEFINRVIDEHDLQLIAVAGTHGKTTTTGLLIWACQQLKIPISYSVGTNISFGPNGRYDPDSKYFIYEADEYDRNFLAFNPAVSLFTAVDYDHPDTYATVAEYQQAFRDLAKQSKQVVTWQGIVDYLDLPAKPSLHVLREGGHSTAGLELLGEHARQNAALVRVVLAKLTKLGENKHVTAALNSFPGTERRLEKLADNLYTDYAHHPAEIAATLSALAELKQPITVVYQPHQNIRQHQVKDDYGDCFKLAGTVYWLPTYLSREDSRRVLTPTELISGLSPGPAYEEAELNDDLKTAIDEHRANGLVVLMSAGDLDSWARQHWVNGQAVVK